MSVDSISASSNTTARGTKIVKSGNDMDKNAFLRILSAELSNQNPDDAKDSTQYVAQMAQFTALEQMQNLNSTMTFSGASSLIGKTVTLTDLDMNGYQYAGVVKGTVKDGGTIKLNIEINNNGTKSIKDFPYEDVYSIQD